MLEVAVILSLTFFHSQLLYVHPYFCGVSKTVCEVVDAIVSAESNTHCDPNHNQCGQLHHIRVLHQHSVVPEKSPVDKLNEYCIS